MNLLDEIRNDANGALILKEWLGDGMVPVPQEKAEHRAQICAFGMASRPCPANRAPGWWDKIKSRIASTIKLHLSVKRRVKLTVKCEEQLHMCAICGCCLPLKVHVPIAHIKEHTPKKVMDKLPSYCWIVKESKL